MKHSLDETIAAIATPLGQGGVGVVRISGDQSIRISEKIIDKFPKNVEPQRVYHGWIVNDGKAIDEVLFFYMRAPLSYTGEDVVEISCHGGVAVLKAALEATIKAGARMAERGEFTKRAFLNQKIDLAQAEAVLDLISAPTAESTGFAVRQLEGKLSKIVVELRKNTLDLLANLEANIDFPEDVPEPDYSPLNDLVARIDALLATSEQGKIYKEGLATVIIGKPNVGKSSLLNALLGEERAIITDIPGTTRDTIEEMLNIRGLPLRIIDTAGIRHPRDKAEAFGVERTEKELSAADFVLMVVDASQRLDQGDEMVLLKGKGKQGLVVMNKIDLGEQVSSAEIKSLSNGFRIHKTSALKGQGISELAEGIFDCLTKNMARPVDGAVVVNSRHKECLLRAKEALLAARQSAQDGLSADFIAIDIKAAVLALGEICGERVSEEVINSIFERFCVGK